MEIRVTRRLDSDYLSINQESRQDFFYSVKTILTEATLSFIFKYQVCKILYSGMDEIKVSNRPDIYVATITEGLVQRVRKCLPNVKVIEIKPQPSGSISAVDIELLKNHAEVLFCSLQVVKNILSEMTNLNWVQTLSAGVNVIDFTKVPTFRVTRMTVNSAIVAEYVITYILAKEKQLIPMYESQKARQWQQLRFSTKRQIKELSICILGVGAIGQAVAKHCKRFGMYVNGVTRTDKSNESSEIIGKYYTVEDLAEVLPLVDYICCCVPSTPETVDMLSGKLLSVCKVKKPILINVGRGTLINESTLVRAVKDGWLGGAVLDTLPSEPLPETSELWTLPNVTITPHISGYNRDTKMLDDFVSTFVENYTRYCQEKPLLNEVQHDRHY